MWQIWQGGCVARPAPSRELAHGPLSKGREAMKAVRSREEGNARGLLMTHFFETPKGASMMWHILYVLLLLIRGNCFHLHSPLDLMAADHMKAHHESERITNDVKYFNVSREELCMLKMGHEVGNFDGRYCVELQLELHKSEMGLFQYFLEYFRWLKFDVMNSVIPGDSVAPLGAQLTFGLTNAQVSKGTGHERNTGNLVNSTAVEMLLKQVFGSIVLDCTYHNKSVCELSKYGTVVIDTVFANLRGNNALNQLLSRPLFDSFIGFPTMGSLAQFDTSVGFWHGHLFSGLDESQFCQSSHSASSGAEDTVYSCKNKTSFISLMPTKKLVLWHQHPPIQWQVKQFSYLLNRWEREGLVISYCEIGSRKLHARQNDMSASTEHGYTTGSAKSIPPCKQHQVYNKENPVEVRLIDLKRMLVGKGSHRWLSSEIKFIYKWNSSKLAASFCEIVMMERLQSGIFVDPFELHRLVHRAALNAAYVYGDANLELPSLHSHQSIVEVHAAIDVDSGYLLGKDIELELRVDLPLHARYPALNVEGYSTVSISTPHVMLQCGHERQMIDMQTEGKEMWTGITWDDNALKSFEVLKWRIPSGNQMHAEFVSIFTGLSALLSIVAIFLASLYSSLSS